MLSGQLDDHPRSWASLFPVAKGTGGLAAQREPGEGKGPWIKPWESLHWEQKVQAPPPTPPLLSLWEGGLANRQVGQVAPARTRSGLSSRVVSPALAGQLLQCGLGSSLGTSPSDHGASCAFQSASSEESWQCLDFIPWTSFSVVFLPKSLHCLCPEGPDSADGSGALWHHRLGQQGHRQVGR